ncbi:MAG: DUF3105 domain-containing protein [Actinomycetota bacterium]|nr:DUF3105 domain-containing protein [Actinomycetota bacterium]
MSKSRKRKPTSSADAHQRKQERLEARRAERAAALEAQRKADLRSRYLRYAVIAAVIALGVWFVFLRGGVPTEIDGNQVQQFSTAGVEEHTSSVDEVVEYETSPPVSGRHASSPAACGTHATQIQNETQVHSLEHGAIGIQFSPDLNPEEIRTIESVVADYEDGVFSGPYEGMEAPIAVTSWGRMMELDAADVPVIREYVDALRNKGPESGQSCEATEDDAFDPNAAASPAPSSLPSPSPSGNNNDGEKKKKNEGSGDGG